MRAAEKLVFGACVAFGCACSAPHGAVGPARPLASAGHAELDRFVADEERLLGMLAAADPRVAARGIDPNAEALRHATMGGILAEDPTMAMEGNRPDVLSFDVRARALEAATQLLAHWKLAPPEPDSSAPSLGQPALEIELLGRMIAAERLRLANERDLARSASILLGGIATTWQTPELSALADRDTWLSRRLAQVTAALVPESLDARERDDLDDALDPLERIIEPLPKSRAALVELRLAVQQVVLAKQTGDRWDGTSRALAADVGLALSSETLLRLLAALSKEIHDEIDQLVGVQMSDARTARALEWLVTAPEPCASATQAAPAPSRIRALEPPRERERTCGLRARVIAAHSADEVLDVLLAMYQIVTTASWSVVIARGGDAAALAAATPPSITPLPLTLEAKLMRFAATRPVEAIDAALSVEWILRNGLGEAALRASAWRAFGDAPLDVIERELHPRAEEKAHLHQSTTVVPTPIQRAP